MPHDYISPELDRRVRDAANHRCGYCLSPQRFVMARLEIEHINPRSKGGTSDESNLWLSCALQSLQGRSDDVPASGVEVPLFNPRTQRWSEHFHWTADGLRVAGLTATGRATVALLHLDDDPDAIEVRSYWVAAGWHPPRDV